MKRKKLLIIIATGNKEKAVSALMYAKNAWAGAWFDDVKVVFFGPSERLVVNSDEISMEVKKISSFLNPYACKAISEKNGISNQLKDLGFTVVGVGSVISKLINEGYIPMVW